MPDVTSNPSVKVKNLDFHFQALGVVIMGSVDLVTLELFWKLSR